MTDGPPDTAAKERDLFVDWTRELRPRPSSTWPRRRRAAGEKKSAPIHVIFFDRYEQRLMLEALARNFPPILEATPPLYDFLTQIAAFDSPIATFLDEEIRTFKNFPMTCQIAPVAGAPTSSSTGTRRTTFRELFKARLFDYLGKLDIDGQSGVVHPAVPVRQFGPAGVRLRRLGPAADAEAGQGRRVRRLPGRDDGPADGLPGAAAGGPGARRQLDPRQPVHPEDAVRPARPGPATRTRPTTSPTPCTSSSPSSGS